MNQQVYDLCRLSASVCEFLEAIARLELAFDGDDLAAVRRGCESAIAKTMEPTRMFDELMLYRLSEASSTAQFSERCAGLAPADAQRSVILARKLKAMPLTEAAWLDGTLTSGQVHAIDKVVVKRFADRYRDDEAEILPIIVGLDARDTDLALLKWVNVTQASTTTPKATA